ncbi:GNAT family N-acetyltransferase [Colwellia sp. 1_MG-2023]|uniref:bifunctional acetyl-CoA hydrolase/transferase family protein/GNAT family N-acetyltransferase n=1 Tax=Colwellia sp. 1_MG-2023 TaxID=3062649 RepID=UPI0026E393A0|nr:bifunctional acetyl-CoA hydrolase/transferase family protein/GNAT family N-acetyltransferase [Colwellia sp. 1_MG-2023]MDO6447491.1 GNAT family N-acetyltransferase [Colwellia sp. 1_MG-2023]
MSLTNKAGTPVQWGDFLKSGNRVFIGSNAAVPNILIQNLIDHSAKLHDIETVHILTFSDNIWALPEHKELFKVNSLFIGGKNVREAVAEGRADYTPCFISEIPTLFRENILPLDAALIMVSPPDEYGYCSLGVSVDVVASAVKSAKYVIAQVNPNMPCTNGHSFIHINQIHAWLDGKEPLPEIPEPDIDQVSERIGQYAAMLVENGSTIQIGIGKIPAAVLRYLANHKDLGVHSEMISDGIIDLMLSGVINNRKKTFHKGKTVVTFCIGSQRLYDFVHKNQHVEFYPSEHINSPVNIAKNDNMVSINSAIEVDLTGQVVSDSIGYHFYSGIGGQVDFVRGAWLSKGGKPVIVLPSTTKDGKISRIVPHVTEGGGVVTSRGHVAYVVTEYGIANLIGKSIRERALELIRIAHPKFREQLLKDVRKNYWVPEYQDNTPTSVPELGAIEFKKYTFSGDSYILRPLGPADERKLQEFFYSHTKETLMMRYNHHATQMTREKSCNLVSVDQHKDLALCFTQQEHLGEVIQAVGRYYYIESTNAAEVAFVIRESQRGKGMATTLLLQIIKIAKKRGLAKLLACVRRDNAPMLKVFENTGFIRGYSEDFDEVALTFDLLDTDKANETQ